MAKIIETSVDGFQHRHNITFLSDHFAHAWSLKQ